jgi:multiple sugar transport system substrate-binding protein
MKTSLRRGSWIFFSLFAALSIILASCAPSTSSTPVVQTVVVTSPPQQQTVQVQVTSVVTQQVQVTTAPGPNAHPQPPLNKDTSGTITFWNFWASPVRRNAVQRLIAICKQQLPNITVNSVVKPFGDIWTANIAAVAAGSGMPDVIIEDRPSLPLRAANGVETNLQPLITKDKMDTSVFWPFTWSQTLYKNESYGIPFETDVRVLWYDKTLFTQAGLDPNNPPKTWDELKAAADKLDKKDANGNYTRIGFLPYGVGNISPDIWNYTNGNSLAAENGTVNINNPAFQETLNWIKSWVDRYGGLQKVQNFLGKFGAAPNDPFMSGAVAMYADIGGEESILNFYRPQITTDDGKKVNMEWGAAQLPYNKTPASWSGGFAMSIPKGAANQAAAWEWIKCATGYDANVSWARDTAAIPTYQAAAQDPLLMSDPLWAVDIAAMKVSTGGVIVLKYPNYTEQLTQRYDDMMSGKLAIQQGLSDAQKAIDAQIAKSTTP